MCSGEPTAPWSARARVQPRAWASASVKAPAQRGWATRERIAGESSEGEVADRIIVGPGMQNNDPEPVSQGQGRALPGTVVLRW